MRITFAMGKDGKNAVRVTTTLSRQQHAALELMAKKNGISISWLVRKAVDMLIEHEHGGPFLPLEFR
jgi:predicted HicB family RNase H-like nuclease